MQISIIEFSVENFMVFKNKATFSMFSRKNEKHTFESNGENLLKTSFIYGPNACGKTSILRAFLNLRQGMLFSANNKENSGLPFFPFLASADNLTKPSFFELVFSIIGENQGIYRYNFSYLKNHIVTENMSKVSSGGTEEVYISRNEQKIDIGKIFSDVDVILNNTRKDALFISQAALFNSPFALSIMDALKKIDVIFDHQQIQDYTIEMFKENPEFKNKILEYLKKADFCISGGRTVEVDQPVFNITNERGEFSTTNSIKKGNILYLEHSKYDENNKKTGTFELPIHEESNGTQNFLSILGPVINVLNEGRVLFIDEFDNSLHPILTKFIVDLFESAVINKNNAQLIVTTHDTSLLSYKDEFIKDQFWFTEKDEFGSAKLFSLADFKTGIRNDTEFSKKYLEGRFGALPFIQSIEK